MYDQHLLATWGYLNVSKLRLLKCQRLLPILLATLQVLSSHMGQRAGCCCSHGRTHLAQRGRLLIHTGHRVLNERGVGHIGGPGVPSVQERRTALLVPLNANPQTFSPAELQEMDQPRLAGHGLHSGLVRYGCGIKSDSLVKTRPVTLHNRKGLVGLRGNGLQ